METLRKTNGNDQTCWRDFTSALRASFKSNGKMVSVGAMLLVGGCAPDAPLNSNVGRLYEDKGKGVFVIDQGKLYGNPDAIATALMQWKADHPHAGLKEIVRIGGGGEGHGGLVLLTDEFFSTNLVRLK